MVTISGAAKGRRINWGHRPRGRYLWLRLGRPLTDVSELSEGRVCLRATATTWPLLAAATSPALGRRNGVRPVLGVVAGVMSGSVEGKIGVFGERRRCFARKEPSIRVVVSSCQCRPCTGRRVSGLWAGRVSLPLFAGMCSVLSSRFGQGTAAREQQCPRLQLVG